MVFLKNEPRFKINHRQKKKVKIFRIYGIQFYSFKTALSKKFNVFNSGPFLGNFFLNWKVKRKFIGLVILLEMNNHPHLLLLGNQSKDRFILPGGTVKYGENEISAAERLLSEKLSPQKKIMVDSCSKIGSWVFPNNDARLKYNCPPPHLRLKQSELSIFIIEFFKTKEFEVDINWDLLAVPFFEIYEKVSKYGSIISKVPSLVSSFLVDFGNPFQIKKKSL